jgi:hypothetical protein
VNIHGNVFRKQQVFQMSDDMSHDAAVNQIEDVPSPVNRGVLHNSDGYVAEGLEEIVKT